MGNESKGGRGWRIQVKDVGGDPGMWLALTHWSPVSTSALPTETLSTSGDVLGMFPSFLPVLLYCLYLLHASSGMMAFWTVSTSVFFSTKQVNVTYFP